jgi:hypothetical protein
VLAIILVSYFMILLDAPSTSPGRCSATSPSSRSEHTPTATTTSTNALDAAYRGKYRRWAGPVARITAHAARATTLRLDPA